MKQKSTNMFFGTIFIVVLVTAIIVAWGAMHPKKNQGYELTEDSLVTLEDSVHFYEDGL